MRARVKRRPSVVALLDRVRTPARTGFYAVARRLPRSGLVAFTNGVFDPGTGTLRPGRREDLLTKHAPIPYDPANPECLQWLERC